MDRRLAHLTPEARALGINIVARPGTGKTRLIGRFFLPQDILQGVPTIAIDFIKT